MEPAVEVAILAVCEYLRQQPLLAQAHFGCMPDARTHPLLLTCSVTTEALLANPRAVCDQLMTDLQLIMGRCASVLAAHMVVRVVNPASPQQANIAADQTSIVGTQQGPNALVACDASALKVTIVFTLSLGILS